MLWFLTMREWESLMKNRNISRLLPLAGLALLALTMSAARAADLTVQIEGEASGQVYIALYDSEQAWSASSGAIRYERGAYAPGYTVTFRDLPPGTYVVGLFVDENDNVKLDRNAAGMPMEKYGVSRNAKGNMGPPSFRDAALDVREGIATTIHLR